MTRTSPRSPLAGVLLTLLLAGVALLVWRTPPSSPPPLVGEVAPVRGGRLTAAVRRLPETLDLHATSEAATLLRLLAHATLVRINPATLDIEPWLAEQWTDSPGGTRTMVLRREVAWSDGEPFTAADVIFSMTLAESGAGAASAADPYTVVFTGSEPSASWLSRLAALPILPRHRLEPQVRAGTLEEAWRTAFDPPAPLPGLGPFVVGTRTADRIQLDRNPHYWRRTAEGEPLPRLDGLTLEAIETREEELRRLEAGSLDLPAGAIAIDDYPRLRQGETQGMVAIADLGVDLAADALWFCLRPGARPHPATAFVQRREFRQALSHAIDREALAHAVFAGHAVPVWGPLTPGHRAWFSPDVRRYAPSGARARELLAAIGLEDRTGDGVLEDTRGVEARIPVAAARGDRAERALAAIVAAVRPLGVVIEAEFVEPAQLTERVRTCASPAAYGTPVPASIDPVAALGNWIGPAPASPWAPRAADDPWRRDVARLLEEAAAARAPEVRRQRIHAVQQILGDEVPAVFLLAPRAYAAYAARLRGIVPARVWPPLLWNADMLGVAGPGSDPADATR